MKKIILLLLLMNSFLLWSQNKSEYMVLRVNYATTQRGLESRLSVELGTQYVHSLKNVVTNGQENTVNIAKPDGTVIPVNSEIDFMNIISGYGFKLKETYPIEVAGRTYVQYIFVKEN